MIGLVADNWARIAALCREYGVASLDVFGSASTGAYDEASSDVDFIVRFGDMSPGIADRYLDLAEALERLLGRPVDLMLDGPIRNPCLRRSVDATRENVFARATLLEAV